MKGFEAILMFTTRKLSFSKNEENFLQYCHGFEFSNIFSEFTVDGNEVEKHVSSISP